VERGRDAAGAVEAAGAGAGLSSNAADRFRVAVEAMDHAAAVETLADDVVFHSPVTFKAFEGRDATAFVLAGVMRVFSNFRYTDQLEAVDGVHALVFRADVGDREIEGIDLVRVNDDDLIDDFTVFVRPQSGLNALATRMAEELGAPPPPS
jgi:limonene-1,2-epoxide hydrolase